MRQAEARREAGEKRRTEAEPLAEGIRKGTRPRGFFDRLSDDEVVDLAKRIVKSKGIRHKTGLSREDGQLFHVLKVRDLISRVGFEENADRAWASMSDDEIVIMAKKLIKQRGLKGKKELRKADPGLYAILWRRKLQNRIGLGVNQGRSMDWASMSDEEVLALARRTIAEERITRPSEFQRRHANIYQVLNVRKLLGEVEFKGRIRDWVSISDERLVELGKKLVKEKGILNRKGLRNEDEGLYDALRKRGLLERIGFRMKKGESRDWASMSDEELVAFAKRLVMERGIKSKNGLRIEDVGLHGALYKRGLLGELGFPEKRNWSSMTEEEFLAFVRRFMREKGICSRGELSEADGGIYSALRRRGLLETVFSDFERSEDKEGLREVMKALGEFS